MTKFTHLHIHTEYSLLDGLSKIEELVARSKEQGMDSLAITDHGVMYGVIPFYLACRKAGIKPIIGVEVYMAHRSRFDKQPRVDADQFHLVLLAKNKKGYKNLMKLTTLAHLEGFYYKPRLDREILRDHAQGLICLSGCLDGEIPRLLLEGKTKEAEEKTKEFYDIFGQDFYLEIQAHPQLAHQEEVNKKIISLSRKLGLPLVATNDVHYVKKKDAEAQDALLAIQTKKLIEDSDRLTMIDSPDFYLRSPEEMEGLFLEYPDAIKNTQKIAQACNLEIPLGEWILPHFPIPEDKTAEKYLREMVEERRPYRFPKASKEIKERIDYELEIICKKGYAPYFLIVQDLVNWAKDQGIRVGPGRGSAAGSLVSYILRITSIDPIKHQLPFERFLNPQRPSPPDIDLDFADDRRDEVISYVTDKYGQDKVAQIITFGRMEARQAVRDVGRVLGMPYSEPDQIAKLIPFGYSIEEALTSVFELQEFYKQAKYKKLLDLAEKVEGCARHASTHAAGVVIADKKLVEYTPLQKEVKGERIITQYDMYALDLNISEKAIGLLKIDLLGLKNLTILQQAREYIKRLRGKEIDISEIPLDDQKVYQMISEGETTGLFQLESRGMRRVAKNLRPNRFSDLIAMIALYRPGPMEWINEFVKRKNNPSLVVYPHRDLKPILEETYGIALYQEQCLHIANVMAGYSLGEADILRRAIGKKKKRIMAREKKKFIQRAKKKDYDEETAQAVWHLIERFAGYGFNKCITGDVKIVSEPDGKLVEVKEAYKTKRNPHWKTLTLDQNQKITPGLIEGIYENGVKPVYQVTTRTGRQITATANHPFLTWKGWKNLEDLKKGERVAVADRIPPSRKISTLNSQKLLRMADSEIFWDEVKSIKSVGRRMTYDLTIKDTHNFVANDFIVHNSHSASYAMIAYQTAYLKTNYPVEFMAAFLTAEVDNKDKISLAIEECKRMKIIVLPPDVNRSESTFTIEKDSSSLEGKAIRFGLSAIKNVGQAAIVAILKARKAGGRFSSLADFCARVETQKVNKKVLESLIQVGAMDEFGKRAAMLVGLEKIRKKAARKQEKEAIGQRGLFESNPAFKAADKLPQVEELARKQLLALEKKLLGFYLTEHPLNEALTTLEKSTTHKVFEIASPEYKTRSVKVGGMITSVRRVFTRKGNNEMAFATLEDETGKINLVIFPRIFEETNHLWRSDQIVIIKGRVDFREERPSVIVRKVTSLKKKS